MWKPVVTNLFEAIKAISFRSSLFFTILLQVGKKNIKSGKMNVALGLMYLNCCNITLKFYIDQYPLLNYVLLLIYVRMHEFHILIWITLSENSLDFIIYLVNSMQKSLRKVFVWSVCMKKKDMAMIPRFHKIWKNIGNRFSSHILFPLFFIVMHAILRKIDWESRLV